MIAFIVRVYMYMLSGARALCTYTYTYDNYYLYPTQRYVRGTRVGGCSSTQYLRTCTHVHVPLRYPATLTCYPTTLSRYPTQLPCYSTLLPYYPTQLPCYPTQLPYYSNATLLLPYIVDVFLTRTVHAKTKV